LTISIFVLLFLAARSHQNVSRKLSGLIANADGSVPQLAHLHILPFGDNPFSASTIIQVDQDGRFELTLPGEKYLEVMVTASDHQRLLFPLLLPKNAKSTELKIQLKQNPYLDDLSGVRITGDWNKFGFGSASPMLAQSDGSYFFETEFGADTVAYQLLDIVTDGRSVNGTSQDKLVYDGGGDYKSVVRVINGKVKIQFDPSKLIKTVSGNEPIVKVLNADESVQQIIDISLHGEQDKSLENTQRQLHLKKNKNLKNFSYDRQPFQDYVHTVTKNASNKLVTRYAMLQLARRTSPQCDGAKSIYNEIIKILPLEDPLWAAEAMSASNIFIQALGSEDARQHFLDNYKKIPHKKVRAGLLVKLGLYAKREGDQVMQAGIFNELKTEYDDVKGIDYYVDQLNPDLGIAKGKYVPDFEIKNIDGDKTISNKKLLGKTYLIDFWATWCAPCVEEMPNLHAVYEKYKDKNFAIVSFSYDRQREAVFKFRKDKWAMPWEHVYLTGAEKEKISKEFEVDGIPKPILIDPQGTIIATEMELRGDDLEKTLSKYLGK